MPFVFYLTFATVVLSFLLFFVKIKAYFSVSQQQQTVRFITIEQLFRHVTNELPDDSFDKSTLDITNTYAIVQAPHLLLCLDMMSANAGNDQTVFVEEDFAEPTEENIHERYGKRYDTEIQHIIESHDAKWIPYQPEGSQISNPLDIDDRRTSIERI